MRQQGDPTGDDPGDPARPADEPGRSKPVGAADAETNSSAAPAYSSQTCQLAKSPAWVREAGPVGTLRPDLPTAVDAGGPPDQPLRPVRVVPAFIAGEHQPDDGSGRCA
ncbi:hypothetical protein GCM10017567_85470 [Amycolatopsis bullii]|uniref:Uncharacterized protein n=1 Tax=Amycolatopsis bullii TaxID=941987 RepID=A0ABQ3KTY1_9PSEU|nr:hypothetical protein GCM10017567_85470 [Amycolatopsis bullii]